MLKLHTCDNLRPVNFCEEVGMLNNNVDFGTCKLQFVLLENDRVKFPGGGGG